MDKTSREIIQEVSMSDAHDYTFRDFPQDGPLWRARSAYKENKLVDLEIIGEETEVDKTIIEQITDPLVHLIRNAVDHGLEPPEVRRVSGKPEAGKLKLEAKHMDGELWIIVQDDGYGLDRKNSQKGCREGAGPGRLPGDEGRGSLESYFLTRVFYRRDGIRHLRPGSVGLDVVKSNIEKLNGKVEVRTRPGWGTVFTVRIPLTLAIIEGMVVRVGGYSYTIPVSSIRKPSGRKIVW